jgi:hypothetical protein
MRPQSAVVLVLAFALCPLACPQAVKVNWNSKAQFSKYKTYSWKPATNPGNPLFAQWVQPDVDAKLGAVGLQSAVKKRVWVWIAGGRGERK